MHARGDADESTDRDVAAQGRRMSASFALPRVPRAWRAPLEPETAEPYFIALREFLAHEAERHEIYPPRDEIFAALELTSLRAVRVLVLGQDPYPGAGQAHGLAFSVRPGVRTPASLRNIFSELRDDVGFRIPDNGYLAPWAKQGVLLLNTVLTVRAGAAGSHRKKGWESFTDRVIERVNARRGRVVFILWGAFAQAKIPLIDDKRHTIITGAHPSPLSAHNGFFGTHPFSRANDALVEAGKKPIDWQLPDLEP
jgi:uracil-DNA glycosylase